jgi:hypothetical protein
MLSPKNNGWLTINLSHKAIRQGGLLALSAEARKFLKVLSDATQRPDLATKAEWTEQAVRQPTSVF